MSFHADSTGSDVHALTAQTYADITARDADSDFSTDSANVDKMVRVESPLSYYILTDIVPTWISADSQSTDEFTELADTPSTYTAQANLLLQVNAGETAVEFTDTVELASLDMTSTTGVFRLPRLTTTQRDALTPLNGMVIFNTTTVQTEAYDGTDWETMLDVVAWTDLDDTPSTITAEGHVRGNTAGDALEFGQDVDITGGPIFEEVSISQDRGTSKLILQTALAADLFTIAGDVNGDTDIDAIGDLDITVAGETVITSTGGVGIGKTPDTNYVFDISAATGDVVGLYDGKGVTIEEGNFGNLFSTDLFFNRADVGFNQSEFYMFNQNDNAPSERYFKMNFTDAGTDGGLSILRDGNIGIGTDTPAETLDVAGNVIVNSGTSGQTSTSSADDLTVENATDAGITILTADLFTAALDFGSPQKQTGAFLKWVPQTELMTLGTGSATSEIALSTGLNTEALRIDASQNSTFKGDVTIDAGDDGTFIINDSLSAETFKIHDDTSNGWVQISSEKELLLTTDTNPLSLFTSSGNITLSTETGALNLLSTSSDISIKSASGNVVINTSSVFVDGDTEFVGIRTITPESQLHVNGAAQIDDTLILSDGSTQLHGSTRSGFDWNIATVLFNQEFDVTGQSTIPTGVHFKVDGTKMFVSSTAGVNSQSVNEYALSTAWDISTATFTTFKNVQPQEQLPQDLSFSTDGIEMYIVGNNGQEVNQYELGTAWDLTTATFDQLFGLTAQTSGPNSIAFKPNGLSMYIGSVENSNKAVFEYTLSSAWNVSTATIKHSFSLPNTDNPRGLSFKPDGTGMYIQDVAGDVLQEYILSTPWDVTTAVLTDTIELTEDSSFMTGLFFKPDSTKMYTCGQGNDAIFEYDMGLKILGNISDGVNAGKVSFNPPSIVEIHSEADLLNLNIDGVVSVTSGVATVNGFLSLTFKALITTDFEFVLEAGSDFQITAQGATGVGILYTGTGTLVSGIGTFATNGFINLISAGIDTSLVSLVAADDASVLVIQSSLIYGWNSLGSFEGGSFATHLTQFVNITEGWTLTDNPLIVCSVLQHAIDSTGTSFTGTLFTCESQLTTTDIDFRDIQSNLASTGSVFDFPTTSDSLIRININTVAANGGSLYKPSTLTDATISTFADVSPSTATITAMADNGDGRTKISCTTTFFLKEEVTISGTTSYNGTFKIDDAIASTSFVIPVEFVADDATGSVDSNRMSLLLGSGHGIAPPDSLKIIGTNFYNGFVTGLSIAGDDLIINGVFVQTETGFIERELSLDETDPRISASNNLGAADSHAVATAYANSLDTATGAIVNNTFRDLVFGTSTSGAGLNAGSTMERWKLVDQVTGIFEYIGNEPFQGSITFDFTVISSGGAVDFRFKWVKSTDGGSSFSDLADPVEASITLGATLVSISKTYPLSMDKGDQLKPQVTRDTGTSLIKVQFVTIYASG